ncbi:regulatory protein CII [Microcystis phage vB_MweS-yong2]|nr:regulatory protein CII [Microcystis phage vB_MweS-yong2]
MGAISDTWFHVIKGATRDLVKVCGGLARASEVALVSDSEVSRWQSSSERTIIPITAALALEAECGLPLVTGAMAGLHGRRLSDPGADETRGAGAARRFADTSRIAVEMIAQGVAATADGAITPGEAQAMSRVAGELAVSAQKLQGDLAAIQAREADPPRGPRLVRGEG